MPCDLPGLKRDQSECDFGAAASWGIDLFGGLRRGAQARAEAQAAEAEPLGTRITGAASHLSQLGEQAVDNACICM